jgi:hypothetical protein
VRPGATLFYLADNEVLARRPGSVFWPDGEHFETGVAVFPIPYFSIHSLLPLLFPDAFITRMSTAQHRAPGVWGVIGNEGQIYGSKRIGAGYAGVLAACRNTGRGRPVNSQARRLRYASDPLVSFCPSLQIAPPGCVGSEFGLRLRIVAMAEPSRSEGLSANTLNFFRIIQGGALRLVCDTAAFLRRRIRAIPAGCAVGKFAEASLNS